jgi:cobaltochelatase CobS
MLELLAPKVDAKQVHEIVNARMAEVIAQIDTLMPSIRVEILKDGVVKPVKGMAHPILPTILQIVGKARKHVFMVGMAGTGKSTIGEQVAEALNLQFYPMSVGPTTSATDIRGYMNSTGVYVGTIFRTAFEHGGVFLFDEIDSGNPGIFTMINSALANGHMAFPDGKIVKRHEDFRLLAAGNTFGNGPDRLYVGRQAMDAATKDRFMFVTVKVDEKLEEAMCMATGVSAERVDRVLKYTRALRANIDTHKMAVLCTPRASEGVCALLAAGLTMDAAIDAAVRKGMSDADWAKVTLGARTPWL